VNEPAADLGVLTAVASSLRNRPVRPGTAVFGEVGLAGEVRGTTQAALRIKEAAQLGFTRCVMPASNDASSITRAGCEAIGVRTVEEALEVVIES
jgi:DNA repair protein RadA/Sms